MVILRITSTLLVIKQSLDQTIAQHLYYIKAYTVYWLYSDQPLIIIESQVIKIDILSITFILSVLKQ